MCPNEGKKRDGGVGKIWKGAEKRKRSSSFADSSIHDGKRRRRDQEIGERASKAPSGEFAITRKNWGEKSRAQYLINPWKKHFSLELPSLSRLLTALSSSSIVNSIIPVTSFNQGEKQRRRRKNCLPKSTKPLLNVL